LRRRPAPVAGLRWFGGRLAETGPHGTRYIRQMTPLLDDAISGDDQVADR
jgi:hypothetical protein